MYALGEPARCARMAEIVEAQRVQARPLPECVPPLHRSIERGAAYGFPGMSRAERCPTVGPCAPLGHTEILTGAPCGPHHRAGWTRRPTPSGVGARPVGDLWMSSSRSR